MVGEIWDNLLHIPAEICSSVVPPSGARCVVRRGGSPSPNPIFSFHKFNTVCETPESMVRT